ncbi:hypothetical protein [Microvirga sp. TS319]|uniref:hypothetical protein n=1 Tax=Microvirga sp. TS319 TaxID=3241165 RepID=UPI00351A85E8
MRAIGDLNNDDPCSSLFWAEGVRSAAVCDEVQSYAVSKLDIKQEQFYIAAYSIAHCAVLCGDYLDLILLVHLCTTFE